MTYTVHTPLRMALSYLKRGWQPVPVPFREKRPEIKEWQTLALTAENVGCYFNGGAQNIGVRLGRASSGLADVDLDSQEAIALAPELLPQTGAVFGRRSKPCSHQLYATNLCDSEEKAALQFKEPPELGGAMLVELRIGGGSKGAQTIFPGSTHETGELVMWVSEGEPARIDGAALKQAVARLAAAALLVRRYPGEGSRHDAALVLGGVLARAGWNGDEIEKLVSAVARHANDPEWRERTSTAKAAVNRLANGDKVSGGKRLAKVWGESIGQRFSEWLRLGDNSPTGAPSAAPKGDLMRPIKDRFCSNVGNALVLLETEPALERMLAFDEMLGLVMLTHPVPIPNEPVGDASTFTPRPLTDEDVVATQTWMQWFALRGIGRNTVHDAISKRAHDCAFHPVRDSLNALQWDGVERLRTWLPDYLDVPQTTYSEAVGAMFLISMVARIFKPGCQADYCLVLEGAQGILKSKACSILGGKWFSNSLPEISLTKESMHHLQGKWLIEITELHAISRAEVSLLKSFISRDVDRYRPPYGRAEVVQPRQCVFIGTTNEKQYLRDHTGNRRFWPVTCGAPNVEALVRDRGQLLAEAVQRYRTGEHWWPDPAFEADHIAPEQEQRREGDAWEAKVKEWLKSEEPERIMIWQVAKEALDLPIARLGRTEQNRIVNILTREGWERGTRTGQGQWWTK